MKYVIDAFVMVVFVLLALAGMSFVVTGTLLLVIPLLTIAVVNVVTVMLVWQWKEWLKCALKERDFAAAGWLGFSMLSYNVVLGLLIGDWEQAALDTLWLFSMAALWAFGDHLFVNEDSATEQMMAVAGAKVEELRVWWNSKSDKKNSTEK